MMQVGSVITVPEQVTFGRDAAMFESLLGFVAELSVVLWAVVVLTLVIRFIGVFMYRRGASRAALAAGVAPHEVAPAATGTTRFDDALQHAEESAGVAAPAAAPRHVPAFAANSTGW